MRKLTIPFTLVMVALLGALVLARSGSADAQEASQAEMASHSLVGAWLLNSDVDGVASAPQIVTFSADGTFHEVDTSGFSGLGAWRMTGDRTAELILVYPGDEGSTWVRASITVAEDGQSFTAQYTLEIVSGDGTGTGQYGPTTAGGTRLEAETPGAPVGTLEELFGDWSEGTPEAATPIS